MTSVHQPHNTRMTGVDLAWLEMDEPHQPMVVSAVLEFERGVAPDALVRQLIDKLLHYERFRQIAEDDRSPPQWVETNDWDWDYHLHIRRGPYSKTAIREAVAEEMALGLDRKRPLWRITLFRRRGGGATLLFRAHHALADGIALMRLLMRNVDEAPTTETPPLPEHGSGHGGLLGPAIDRLESLNDALSGMAEIWREDLHHPQQILHQFQQGRRALAAAARILTLPDDNPACLHGSALTGHRVLAWEECEALDKVRDAAHANGSKVNDILLAALAGAFGHYVEVAEGSLPPEQNLRVSIPVNLRKAEDDQLGNCFGLVLLDLPIGVRDATERLHLVATRMQALKDSGEAAVILGGLAAAGHMPVAAEKRIVRLLSGKAAAVVSNLPGPQQTVHFAQTPLRSIAFWPPQAGGIGIGVSVLSYDGRILMGVSADTAAIRNPQIVVDAFRRALRASI